MRSVLAFIMLFTLTLWAPAASAAEALLDTGTESQSAAQANVSISPIKDDTTENRLELAKQYLKLVPLKPLIQQSLEETANHVPADKRQAFVQTVMNKIDFPKLNTMTLDLMVRHFNTQEIGLMMDFYGSPTGKSIIQKYPAFMGDVMSSIRAAVHN